MAELPALMLVLAAAVLVPPTPPSSAQATTPGGFTPVADAYVNGSLPNGTYGSRPFLRVDNSPTLVSFLRFDVQGVGDFSSAMLQVYVEAGSSTGFQVSEVLDDHWDEATIDAATAPAVGASVAGSGAVGSGTWATLDVSPLVTEEGPVTLALTTTSSTAMRFSSREGANPPRLFVPAPPSPSPFVVSPTPSGYEAVSTASGATYTGNLASVVQAAAGDLVTHGGGTISFGVGTFDLGGDSLRLEAVDDVTFEGQGVDVTVIQNWSDAAADSTPFSFTRSSGVAVRDLTISAGGPFRATSAAIDLDGSNDSTIDRVKITSSRGRGIVLDGKNAGATADRNTIRDCVIAGLPGDGIEVLAASDNLVEGCTITMVGGHGIQVTKATSSAAQPNKKANGNVLRSNTIDEAGGDGIDVVSSDRNTISGNHITNSANVTANRDGIRIQSTNAITCDDNVIEDNVARDNQAVKTQSYGLAITSSLCMGTVVSGNDFSRNRVGEIKDFGTATQLIGDTEPPSVPGQLIANGSQPFQVELAWDSATDNVAVAGYTVYRDGVAIGTSPADVYYYLDSTVDQETSYQYAVDAFDEAGNHSEPSESIDVTTPPLGADFSVVAEADAYVNAVNPTANYGTSPYLRSDGSPEVRSYLRFTVRGIPASMEVQRATLRVWVNSASSIGHEARPVADNNWDEQQLTYSTAPAVGPVLGSSGGYSVPGFVDVDVTSAVTGNGTFSLAITSPGTTAISYKSRETAQEPHLVIETGPPAPPPPSGVLLSDDFETGDLARWATTTGIEATSEVSHGGAFAARATSVAGGPGYARAPLSSATYEATISVWVNVLSLGSDNVYLFRALETGFNTLVGVYVTPDGRIAVRNAVGGGGGSTTSSTTIGPGWHQLTMHVVVGGPTDSLTEVWLDSVPVMTRTDTLGENAIARFEIGERTSGRTFDLAFDDISVSAP